MFVTNSRQLLTGRILTVKPDWSLWIWLGTRQLGKAPVSSNPTPYMTPEKEMERQLTPHLPSQTVVSEIFPLSIRGRGASIGASSNWVNNFAIAFFVPPMFAAWAWGTYIFFAVFLAAGIVWIYFYLPETKNASLEEMDRIFGSHTGEEDARMLVEAQRDVGLFDFVRSLEGDGKKGEKMG